MYNICQSLSCRLNINETCIEASAGARDGTICAPGKVKKNKDNHTPIGILNWIKISFSTRFACKAFAQRAKELHLAIVYLATISSFRNRLAWASQVLRWPAMPCSNTSIVSTNRRLLIAPIPTLDRFAVRLAKVFHVLFNLIRKILTIQFYLKEYDRLECTDKYFDCPRYRKVCKTSSINGVSLNILCPRTCGRCSGTLFSCANLSIYLAD